VNGKIYDFVKAFLKTPQDKHSPDFVAAGKNMFWRQARRSETMCEMFYNFTEQDFAVFSA